MPKFLRLHKIFISFLCAPLFVLISFASFSQSTVVSPAPAVTNLCVGGTSIVLGDIVVTETINNGFTSTGTGLTFILAPPANFHFVAGTGTLTYTTNRLSAGTITNTATTLTVSFTNAVGGFSDKFTISNLEVIAITAAASGDITRSGGSFAMSGQAATGSGITYGFLSSNPATTTTNPGNKTVCSGVNTTFNVTGGGTGLTYQWRENSIPLTNTGIYGGVTTPTLVLTGVTTAITGNTYDVVVTGNCGNATSTAGTLTVRDVPAITTNPSDVVACEGSGTSFTIAATGFGLSRQWQVDTGAGFTNLVNGAPYAGVTNLTLNISNVLGLDGFKYRCVVTGTCAPPAISTAATITERKKPAIVTLPANSTICAGNTTNFTVVATGTNLTYQWRENNVPLTNTGVYSGVTTEVLTITGAPATLNGKQYDVVVSGTCTPAQTTTPDALLTVNALPAITTNPTDKIVCEGTGTTFTAAATGTGIGYQWQVNSGGGYADLTNVAPYSNVTTATLSISDVIGLGGFRYRAVVTGTCGPQAITTGAILTERKKPVVATPPSNSTICVGNNTSFTVVATGSTLTYQWRDNTTPLTNTGVYSGVTTSTLTITGATAGLNGKNYNCVVSGACAPPATSADGILTVNTLPTITTNPADAIVCEGTSTTFTAAATGTGIGYQWQVDTGSGFTNLTNVAPYSTVTGPTLNISDVINLGGNRYRAVVTGTCSPSATTTSALLTERKKPFITTAPVASVICESNNTLFTVAATGTGLTYQWFDGATLIPNGGVYSGATTATLSLTSVPLLFNLKNYSVTVTGTCAPPVSSIPVVLTVNSRPIVTVNPIDVTVCEGTGTTFTATGTGTGIGYQWQVDAGSGFTNLTNVAPYSTVATNTLNISDVVGLGGNRYRVVVTGTCGPPANSTAATLTERKKPVIVTPPSASIICEGNNTTFNVIATGSGLTYQWFDNIGSLTNGAQYSGVTTSTLTVIAAPATLNGKLYHVEVTGLCAPLATHAGVLLTVNTLPVITTNPVDVIVCEGTGTTFSVAATGTGVGYQWQVDTGSGFTNLTNVAPYSTVTTTTLNISNVIGLGGYRYRAVVTGTCFPPANSTAATLTERKKPVITTTPVPSTICEGNNTSFNVVATGTGLTYQWFDNVGILANGGVYSGVTTSTLTLTAAPATLNGKLYHVEVTGLCAPLATHAGVLLTVNTLPVITTNPVDVIVCEGTGTTFTVAATGTGVGYQWQVDSGSGFTNLTNVAPYSTVTTTTLNISDVIGLGGNRYRAVVTGTCAPVANSTAATLTERKKPVIVTPPSASIICEGNNTTFNVIATGTGLTYQWFDNIGSLTNGAQYSGVTTSTLTVIAAPATLNGKLYHVEVTGLCAPLATHAGVLLTVNTLPVITTNPVDVIVCEGTGTTFSVAATGTGVGYQWQVDTGSGFTNLTNVAPYSTVTTTTLNISNVIGLGGYRYRAVVTGTCFPPANSTAATLTERKKPVIVTPPSASIICEGNNTTFNVIATGSGLTYQWFDNIGSLTNGAQYSGVTTSTLNVIAAPATLNGKLYHVEVTGLCAPLATHAGVLLTVNTLPVITTNPVDVIVCEGTGTTFSVAATGTGVGYQWQVDTGSGFTNLTNVAPYSTVTTTTLNISNVIGLGGYRYRAVVTGTCFPPANSTAATLTERKKPVITTTPVPSTICEGNNTSFNVVATGTGLTYQWFDNVGILANGGVYSGVTTSTLTLTAAPATLNGKLYHVEVTGLCAPLATHAGVLLTVNTLPVITTNPVDVIVCEGTGTTFTVAATGTGVGYQWQVDSGSGFTNLTNVAPYSTVTTTTLNISDVIGLGGNRYRAVVTGTCAPVANSTAATLTERKKPVIVTPPSASIICEGNNTTFNVIATGTGLTYQWFDNIGSLTNGAQYSGVTTSTLTVIAAPATLNGKLYHVEVTGLCAPLATHAGVLLTVNTLPVITTNPVDVIVCEGTGTTFTVAASGTGVGYQWQVDTGSGFTNLTNVAPYSTVTTTTLNISNVIGLGGYRYRAVVTGTCFPPANSTAATLTERKKPVIVTPPSASIICEGNNTSFNVVATGTGLTYQWFDNIGSLTNGAQYSGVTTSTLTVIAAPATLNGKLYHVEVTGLCAPLATHAGVLLTVNTLPVITTNPVDVIVCEGTGTTFSVAATGTGVGYQWQVDAGSGYTNLTNVAPYSTVTTTTLNISDVIGLGGNRYRAVVTGTCFPPANSTAATLTERKKPIITTTPVPSTICEGNNTSFNVVATGTGLTYQWFDNIGSLTNGAQYSGVTTSTLNVIAAPATLNGKLYHVEVTGLCAPLATHAGVLLTVNTLPVITTNPVDVIVCEGTGTTFTVAASGTGVGYQWQVDSGSGFTNLTNVAPYSTVTTTTLNISNVIGLGGYRYRAVVTGTCFPPANSTAATLTERKKPVITTTPVPSTICEGNNTSFNVVATGTGLTYQWFDNVGILANGGVYSGVTTSTLTLTAAPSTLNGKLYHVEVTGLCAPLATHAGVLLTVNSLPVITSNPADVALCEGTATSFAVVASGTSITYKWQVNTGSGFTDLTNVAPYSNVTTPTLNISDVIGLGGYRYRAVVTGTCFPPASSTAATITERKKPIGTTLTLAPSCSDTPFSYDPQLQISNGVASAFTWNASYASGLSVGPLTGSGPLTGNVNNVSGGPLNVTFIVHPISTFGCVGLDYTLTVPIASEPKGSDFTAAPICSDVIVNYDLQANVTAVNGMASNFTWIATSNTNVGGESLTAKSGPIINDVLINIFGSNQSVLYTVTPTSTTGACIGNPFFITIPVKSRPTFTNSALAAVCSSTPFSYNPQANIGNGMISTFTWTGAYGAGLTGGIGSSTGLIAETLTNLTSGTLHAIYTVFPATGGCVSSTSFTVDVPITPQPTGVSQSVAVCSTQALGVVMGTTASSPVATSYDIISIAPGGLSSISGVVSGPGQTANELMDDKWRNTTSLPVAVTYTVVPYNATCKGAPFTITATINPEPVGVTKSVAQCSDVSVNYNLLNNIALFGNNVGSTFTWIVATPNPNVGNQSVTLRTTAIIDDPLNNVTSTDQVVDYTVTPTAVTGCLGASFHILVTVHPEPVGLSTAIPKICSGSTVGYSLQANINTQNSVASTFTWFADPNVNVTGASISTQTTSTINDALVNTTFAIQMITYHVTPTGTNGCAGDPFTLTIQVYPNAVVSAGPDLSVCNDPLTPFVTLQGTATFAPNGIIWTKNGTGTFQPNNTVTMPDYHYSAGDVGLTRTFTITATDPDGLGPCLATSDVMTVKINKLPNLVIFNLPPFKAENQSPFSVNALTQGGLFSISPGSGLGSTTVGADLVDHVTFDPAAASLGLNTVSYSYTDPVTGCSNLVSQNIFINAITNIGLSIQNGVENTATEILLCGYQGVMKIEAQHDPTAGPGALPFTRMFQVPAYSGQVMPATAHVYTDLSLGSDGGYQYFFDTDSLPSDLYAIEYDYENSTGAQTIFVKYIRLYAAPTAAFNVPNHCISSAINFTDMSTLPPATLPNAPPAPVMNQWTWDFGDNKPIEHTKDAPHDYDAAGVYLVKFTVGTNQNCFGRSSASVQVGDEPTVDFKWSSICNNDSTKFNDLTMLTGVSTIVNYQWDFGDGNIVSGPNGGTIPFPTNLTSGTYKDPNHKFAQNQTYPVVLSVVTDDGCTSFKEKDVFTLAYTTVPAIPSAAYTEDFESNDGGWKVEAITPGDPISWQWGTPNGTSINATSPLTTNAWWTGGHLPAAPDNTSYYPSEQTVVNGPCFDLSQLTRPMVSLDYWVDTQDDFDGAVLQYSVDGGNNWVNIGLPNEGINWYTKDQVIANPGGQLVGQYGWTGESGKWLTARANLDTIPDSTAIHPSVGKNPRRQVRIRIAFASDQLTPPATSFDGFAFDNIYVGEKKRNVLLEHFTNSTLVASVNADIYLDRMYKKAFDWRGVTDFHDIRYHVSYPDDDPLNLDNQGDPAARALYLQVPQPPYTIMDGITDLAKFNGVLGTGGIDIVEVDRRSLVDPKFDLVLTASLGSAANKINVQLDLTADTILNEALIAQVALIEKTTGGFNNVLRRQLFEGSGETIPAMSWVKGTPFTVQKNDIEITVPITDPSQLLLVAYVQNKNTREIYQSRVMNAPPVQGGVFTGIGEPGAVVNVDEIQLYPNPANGAFEFGLPNNFPSEYTWKIVDQRGVTVSGGDFENALDGRKEVSVNQMSNGVYVVIIGAPGKPSVHRKLVVLNRH